MPMSPEFKNRLTPILPDVVDAFGTPFHIYDEAGILNTCDLLNQAFEAIDGFKEFFAVKALPNPAIMSLLKKRIRI